MYQERWLVYWKEHKNKLNFKSVKMPNTDYVTLASIWGDGWQRRQSDLVFVYNQVIVIAPTGLLYSFKL